VQADDRDCGSSVNVNGSVPKTAGAVQVITQESAVNTTAGTRDRRYRSLLAVPDDLIVVVPQVKTASASYSTAAALPTRRQYIAPRSIEERIAGEYWLTHCVGINARSSTEERTASKYRKNRITAEQASAPHRI
jgi:hypothetical protein